MRVSKWVSALLPEMLPAMLTAALALLSGAFVVQSVRADNGADNGSGALVDPTAPQIKVVAALNTATPAIEYRLSGIWHRNGRTMVVINGATVLVGGSVGGSVDGARVVSVADETVTLRLSDGSTMRLRSSPQVVRRATNTSKASELAARD